MTDDELQELRLVLGASDEDIEAIEAKAEQIEPAQPSPLLSAAVALAENGFDTEEILTLLDPISWGAKRWLIPPEELAHRLAPVLQCYRIPADHARPMLETVDQIVTRNAVTVTDVLRMLKRLGSTIMASEDTIMTDDTPDGVDRVQYVLDGEDHLTTVESSIVPERNDLVVIDGEEYHVYYRTHAIEEDGHLAMVHVWHVDEDSADYMETIVRKTLRGQRQKHEDWKDGEDPPGGARS